MNRNEETEARYRLDQLLDGVRPSDQRAMETAAHRWNSVAKPIKSLGILEEDLIRIAGMKRKAFGLDLRRSALVVMCADHGVVAEGVTQTGQEVTEIVARNFAAGKTSVTIMCRTTGTDVFPVDMGMICEPVPDRSLRPFVLVDRKIRRGSRNLAEEAAMTREECLKALLSGIEIVGELKSQGYAIVATGEMGIGNTTPSSAMAAVLTGLSAKEATGRGAGLSDAGLHRKQEVIFRAVSRFRRAHPEISGIETREEALTLLAELGGFDLAGIAGLFLGGAVYEVPVVADGFISTVAALLAIRLCPAAKDYMLASHVSSENAGRAVLNALGLKAPLDCGMHLGEGSGAVALLPLLFMGADVYEKMSSFEEIHVDAYEDYETGQEEMRP